MQDTSGKALTGRALADCPEMFGDHLEYAVSWKDATPLGSLAGKPVRMRVELKDADLFSFRFA